MLLVKPMILQKLINLLVKTYDFIKTDKFINKNTLFYKKYKHINKTFDFIKIHEFFL